MRLIARITALSVLPAALLAQPAAQIPAKYREAANRIIAAARADSSRAWNRVAAFTDRFGGRLSGSQALEDAIDWTMTTMRAD